MLWSQCPYEVVMSFTRSKPGPRAVRKIGRNLSGTTHPTLPPIGGRPSYSRPKRNCNISLSETNADCVGDTREGRIGLSLATMIFDMILYMTEQRLMGRIYVINRGLSFLGIKQI
ncbi:unnamed protein product [Cochlearia groenlandica]